MFEGKEEAGIPSRPVHEERWHLAFVIAMALAAVLLIRSFIAQPFIVRGASMEPSFMNYEYLIIDELSYLLRPPKRGEPIIFRYPRDTRQFFIKRIIGLPNERVRIADGRVSIIIDAASEGVLLDQPYLDPPNRPTHPDMEVALGPDQYFVMGDNRDASFDSRTWGAVERRFLIGRALFRAWPFPRFGLIPEYP